MTRDCEEHRRLPAVAQHRRPLPRPPRLTARQLARAAAAVGLALTLAGCADVRQRMSGWFSSATPTPAPPPASETKSAATAPRVYFAGSDGLKLYSEPSASSKVLGALSLHEKVTRFKLEHGFAYVESATGGGKGWVINAQLIWRLPSATTTTAPAAAAPEPEAPEEPAEEPPQAPPTPAAAAEPTATPTSTFAAAPPSPQTTPRGVAPSIFNPY